MIKLGTLIRHITLPLLFCSLLSACSTYSKRECTNFNWGQRGYASALNGEVKEIGIAHYYKECNDRHGIQPQDKKFGRGYKKGLKVFCTPSFAEKFADRGGEYAGVCTAKQEKGFLKPYVKGINKYYKNRVSELESEIGNLESKISDLESDKSNLESDVSRLESDLSSCQ